MIFGLEGIIFFSTKRPVEFGFGLKFLLRTKIMNEIVVCVNFYDFFKINYKKYIFLVILGSLQTISTTVSTQTGYTVLHHKDWCQRFRMTVLMDIEKEM